MKASRYRRLSADLARALVLALLCAGAVFDAARAQSISVALPAEVHSTIVVGDTSPAPGRGFNNPVYLPPPSRPEYSGIVALVFNNPDGSVASACSGTLIASRKILTSASCAAAPNARGFTARFRNADGSYTAITGTDVAIPAGPGADQNGERNIGVLTLDADAPGFARRYSLFGGNPLIDFTMAGYGNTGTGLTGDVISSGLFGAEPVLRSGRNHFDYSTAAIGITPDPGDPQLDANGAILFADFDPEGESGGGRYCDRNRFCGVGIANESGLGGGDLGSAAFTDTWSIVGVASFFGDAGPPIGRFGSVFGYLCVSNYARNRGCKENFDFVTAQLQTPTLVPEPATGAMLLIGVLLLAPLGRRMRATR